MNAKTKIAISKLINKFGLFVSSNKTLPKTNLMSFLSKLQKTGYTPNLVLDIGANKSSWSKEASVFFPKAYYFLVEPQNELNSHLESFCNKYKNAEYINYGVGNKVEERLFTINPDTVSSTFNMTEEQAKEQGYKQRNIKLTTVNEIIKNNLDGKCPDIIKIDAEGNEYDILQGASDALGKAELIFLELHFFKSHPDRKDFSDMIQIMSDFGYAPVDFTFFLPRTYDGFLGLTEVAFALKNGKVRKYKGW